MDAFELGKKKLGLTSEIGMIHLSQCLKVI